ncbi:hypothetical protein FACS1894133_2120 [Clostridia bacterium]|nr:hypothetical protein FACS1894133_2120 [Clostridia bacterium]
MLSKIKTPVAALLTAAMLITSVSATKAPTPAPTQPATIESRAKSLKLGESASGRLVEGTTFVASYDNTYGFSVSGKTKISIRIRSEAANTQYFLTNSSGKLIQPTEAEYASGSGIIGDGMLTSMTATALAVGVAPSKTTAKTENAPTAGSQMVWSEFTGRADATFKYDIPAGSYYLGLYKLTMKSGSKSGLTDGTRFEIFINKDAEALPPPSVVPVAPTSPIIRGVTQVSDLRVGNISQNRVEVHWSRIENVQYAIYYTYRNNKTGAFAQWTVLPLEVNGFNIVSPALGSTYYISVLPFSETPTRVYGNFSNYVVANTDYLS